MILILQYVCRRGLKEELAIRPIKEYFQVILHFKSYFKTEFSVLLCLMYDIEKTMKKKATIWEKYGLNCGDFSQLLLCF